MGHAVEELTDEERIIAKSWADSLFHQCPLTEKFFDKNVDIADIPTRQEQKIQAMNEGKSLSHAETSKYFEKSNTTTIKHNLRPQFNIYMQLALKNGATSANQALSHKKMLQYVKWREKQVYDKKLTPDSFKEYMSKLRILANMSTVTEGFPNVNVDETTRKATNRVNEWFAKNKDSDPKLNDKRKVNAYKGDEPERIIEQVKNEKVKVALKVALTHGFRIENASTLYLNTQWKKMGRTWVREYTPENKVAIVSKGSQRHTVTIKPELFEQLKEYANKRNVFHVSARTVQDVTKKAAEKAGVKYISVHNFRATQAYRLYNSLKETNLYTEEQIKKMVSKNLFHGRTDITDYYLKSANKGD